MRNLLAFLFPLFLFCVAAHSAGSSKNTNPFSPDRLMRKTENIPSNSPLSEARLSELRLVGIIYSTDQYLALIQFANKVYKVRKGQIIGKNPMLISDILENKIVLQTLSTQEAQNGSTLLFLKK